MCTAPSLISVDEGEEEGGNVEERVDMAGRSLCETKAFHYVSTHFWREELVDILTRVSSYEREKERSTVYVYVGEGYKAYKETENPGRQKNAKALWGTIKALIRNQRHKAKQAQIVCVVCDQ